MRWIERAPQRARRDLTAVAAAVVLGLPMVAHGAIRMTDPSREPDRRDEPSHSAATVVQHGADAVRHLGNSHGSASPTATPVEASGTAGAATADDVAENLGVAGSKGTHVHLPTIDAPPILAPADAYFPRGARHGIDGTLNAGDDVLRGSSVFGMSDNAAIAARGAGSMSGEASQGLRAFSGLAADAGGGAARVAVAAAEGAGALKVVTLGAGAAGAAAVAARKKNGTK